MTSTMAKGAVANGTETADPAVGRAGTVRARRRWPGSRATVGGLLVAVAALATFWAFQQAGAGDQQTFVTAARDLAPGHVLAADDLIERSGELAEPIAGRTFRHPADLVGGVVTRALTADELIDVSDVAAAEAGARPRWELSMGLDPARVVAATGDVVDIVAAVGSGEQARSEVVATGVRIQRIDAGDSFENGMTVTLGLDSVDDVLAVSRATRAGDVFVVRTTGDAGR